MPKVRNTPSKGVRVFGSVQDLIGRPVVGRTVIVSTSGTCIWNGKVLVRKQAVETDSDGGFEFWLPPTSELRSPDKLPVPGYTIFVEGIGAWALHVPDGIVEMEVIDGK